MGHGGGHSATCVGSQVGPLSSLGISDADLSSQHLYHQSPSQGQCSFPILASEFTEAGGEELAPAAGRAAAREQEQEPI